MRSNYIPLGLLRLSMAMMVFFAHSEALIYAFQDVAYFGELGVALFFFVSGYIIFYSYYTFYHESPVRFAINRGLRIYPTLWFCFAVAFMLAANIPELANMKSNVTIDGFHAKQALLAFTILFGNLDSYTWAPLSPGWSLHVEMKFYVISTVLFFMCRYVRTSAVLYFAAVMSIGSYVMTELLGGWNRFYGELQFIPFFALGVSFFFNRLTNSIPSFAMFFLSLIGSCYFILTHKGWLHEEFSLDCTKVVTLLMFLLYIGAVFFKRTYSMSDRSRRFDKAAGDMTYPLYLIHFPIMSVVEFVFGGGMWAVLMALALSLASAFLTNRLIEQPVYSLRDRLRGVALTA